MTKIILFNKPFGILSQFTPASTGADNVPTLADYIDIKNIYPAGRLDKDSEGLMVLTDDGKLQARIANPKAKTPKTYLAQVEGRPDEDRLNELRNGLLLKDGRTKPAKARVIDQPDWLWARIPPVRERKTVPDHWLEITLTEGRNRQVRRMTAAIGTPTLRLLRISIGDWHLENMATGTWRQV